MGGHRVVILGVPCCFGVSETETTCSWCIWQNAILGSTIIIFQGFTYVAPSVLESVKEKFSFEPKIRSPRRFIGSPRTPVRYSDFVILTSFFFFFLTCKSILKNLMPGYINERSVIFSLVDVSTASTSCIVCYIVYLPSWESQLLHWQMSPLPIHSILYTRGCVAW